MIRKKSDMRGEVRPSMRGGKGTSTILHMVEIDELLGKARLAGYVIVPVGGSVGNHVHDPDAEIVIVSSGKARAVENGKAYEFNVGDVMFTGAGGSHSFENIGDTPLELIGIVIE